MKYPLSFIMIALLAGAASAVDVESVLQDRARAAQLPPTDSAILYQGTTITLHEDGRMDREEHLIRYLRTDNSWDDYGDPHLSWDTERQELEVEIARTYTTDGRKIDSTPNAFNPMVPFGLDLAPAFMNYRQMVVTHLGIETDAIIELKYTVRDTKPLYPWAWGEVLLAGAEPVLQRELTVCVPLKIGGWHQQGENGAREASYSRDGEWDVFTWSMSDLPAYNTGEAGAAPSRSLPRVVFSTCPTWTDLRGEVAQRFSAAMEPRQLLHAALADYRNLGDFDQRLDSAAAFVKNRIALKNYPDAGMMLRFRPADEVYASGYGSPADLAALHAAVLADLGMEPEVALVAEREPSVPPDLEIDPGYGADVPRVEPYVPLFTGRETYLIHVRDGADDAWLDPSSGKLGVWAPAGSVLIGILPTNDPVIRSVAAWSPPAAENFLQLDLILTIKDDGSADGSLILRGSGASAPYAKGKSGADKLIQSWTEAFSAAPEVKNARITRLEPGEVRADAELHFALFGDSLGDLRRFVLPWDVLDSGLLPGHLALNHPHRDLPLCLDHAGTFILNAQVRYPESWRAETVPLAGQTESAGLTFGRDVESQAGRLTVRERVQFGSADVLPDQWNDWRRTLLAATKGTQRTLLLNTAAKSAEQASR